MVRFHSTVRRAASRTCWWSRRGKLTTYAEPTQRDGSRAIAVSRMNALQNRQNTLVCTFDMSSPRISAYDIHEWIHVNMKLEPTDVIMIQIDSTKRQVYLKLHDDKLVHSIIRTTTGQLKYKHPSGEVSNVTIEMAGTRTTRVRLANLPPEIGENIVRNTLHTYGEIQGITNENWTNRYRYPVANGIRLINMKLTKHIPSNLMMAGHRVLITYDGQPITCYGCGAEDHFYIDCPNRSKQTRSDMTRKRKTWATVAATGAHGGDSEPEAGTPGNHENNTPDDTQTEEGQHRQTLPATQKQTYKTDNTTAGEENGAQATDLLNTVNGAEGHSSQPMDVTEGCQSLEQTQNTQPDMQPKPKTGEDRVMGGEHTVIANRRQVLSKEKSDQQESISWAEEVENSTEIEELSEQTQVGSPKRTKKLKVEKGETKPPDRGRSRSRHTGKRN